MVNLGLLLTTLVTCYLAYKYVGIQKVVKLASKTGYLCTYANLNVCERGHTTQEYLILRAGQHNLIKELLGSVGR